MEKHQGCQRLSSNKSNIGIKQLSIPREADWLHQFAEQSLTTNTENLSSPSEEEFSSFLDDIKCLEYSHTPFSKMQLLTSAFRKCEAMISKLKITSSWVYDTVVVGDYVMPQDDFNGS